MELSESVARLRLPTPAKMIRKARLGMRRRHKLPKVMAMATSTSDTISSMGRVPIHWMSAKPVMKVPKMAPAVETA